MNRNDCEKKWVFMFEQLNVRSPNHTEIMAWRVGFATGCEFTKANTKGVQR